MTTGNWSQNASLQDQDKKLFSSFYSIHTIASESVTTCEPISFIWTSLLQGFDSKETKIFYGFTDASPR